MLLFTLRFLVSGSAEGFNQADKAINTAVKSGRWVRLVSSSGLCPQDSSESHGVTVTLCVQVGDAEERAPGPGVADAAGEEAALPAAARLLPALPHHGDQPQGNQDGSL